MNSQPCFSWQQVGGYPVYRMWFIGSDASKFFVEGQVDGKQRIRQITAEVRNF